MFLHIFPVQRRSQFSILRPSTVLSSASTDFDSTDVLIGVISLPLTAWDWTLCSASFSIFLFSFTLALSNRETIYSQFPSSHEQNVLSAGHQLHLKKQNNHSLRLAARYGMTVSSPSSVFSPSESHTGLNTCCLKHLYKCSGSKYESRTDSHLKSRRDSSVP